MRMRPFWMVSLALILAGAAVFLAQDWLLSQKSQIVEVPAEPQVQMAHRASSFLATMDEPVLSENKEPGFEAYRLVTASDRGGIGRGTVVVRVQNENGVKTLVVKLGRVKRTYRLTPQKWDEIVRLVDEADYWHLATFNGRLGLHGWACLLEGVKDGQYHVVDRWEPYGEELPFRTACEYLESFAFHTEAKPEFSLESITNDHICYMVLATRQDIPRRDHRPVPSRFAAEAKRRGLSPQRCTDMLSVAESLSNYSICQARRGTLHWDHRLFPSRIAAEAKRRGLSPQRCASLLAN